MFSASGLLTISAVAQTLTVLTFTNPSFSAMVIINHTRWAQVLVDEYVEGFPETTFVKPALLPSERLHIERA
jgi:hypothetical protein